MPGQFSQDKNGKTKDHDKHKRAFESAKKVNVKSNLGGEENVD